jgi:cytochrome bd ubiquinol oxidase subunit II
MEVAFDLTIAWAILLAFAIYVYVVLDGFDLGIGILYPFFGHKRDRDLLMNTVAPVWDGNETWLVLGGGGLFAAFPLAYAIIMPAVYPPVIAMLLALVFRGVAFEARWRAQTRFGEWFWDASFNSGSTMAALAQGVILGALLQGIAVEGRGYAGGWWDWLTPFSLLCGAAVVSGYALLGACWLNFKTSGDVQDKARRLALPAGLATVMLIGAVSLWTPFLEPLYFERWFGWPTAFFSAFVPLLIAICAVGLWWSLNTGRDLLAFLAALGLFVLSYVGIGISFYPYIVPGALTIHEAAAPDASLGFLLIGAVVLIPIILAYTGYAYWVFRGKVDPEEGYH